MIGRQPCMRCSNFIEGERSPFTWKCKAFPDGIPYEHFAYIDDEKRKNCNNGIGFEPDEEQNDSN